MTLLNDFLIEMAGQVNIANGFSAEEIDYAQDGTVPTPRNFFLTFNRLGGRFTWDNIIDTSILKYYELRTNTLVGSQNGLLETTLNNYSTVMPLTFIGTVYLYAVDQNGNYSNFTRINYSKPRPYAPKNLALTKNNEGTLIYFDPIPSDCIGANIYINSHKHQVLDNLFLFTEETTVENLGVAYYDIFGEGEIEYLYTIPPDVTGFMVERNGVYLDFYWDTIPIYGVKYMIKVGQVYEGALEVFTTKDNKHRLVFPITGESIFWIKAIDEQGNMSKNPAYISTANALDINKNIILRFEQEPAYYPGNKINIYYDIRSEGIKLDKDALFGEYITPVSLPKVYHARNWVDYKVLGVTNADLDVKDFDFTWDSKEASITTWLGMPGDLTGTTVKSEISRHIGLSVYDTEVFSLDKTLNGIRGTVPTESKRADNYQHSRWGYGLFVNDLTRVAWKVPGMTEVFNLTFYLKIMDGINCNMVMMTLRKGASFFMVGFNHEKQAFYLVDNQWRYLEAKVDMTERDWLTFGISQGENKRRFFVNSYGKRNTVMAEGNFSPVGIFDTVYLYEKIII